MQVIEYWKFVIHESVLPYKDPGSLALRPIARIARRGKLCEIRLEMRENKIQSG